jgi:hypothetical protein
MRLITKLIHFPSGEEKETALPTATWNSARWNFVLTANVFIRKWSGFYHFSLYSSWKCSECFSL